MLMTLRREGLALLIRNKRSEAAKDGTNNTRIPNSLHTLSNTSKWDPDRCCGVHIGSHGGGHANKSSVLGRIHTTHVTLETYVRQHLSELAEFRAGVD